MQKSPPPFIWACPEEKNILDWHFIIRGPPDTPYEGGEYHGLIWFPSDYPFKPPDVKMFTPSGRFETGHKICMSMTSYHPSTYVTSLPDRWNAAWSVATILTGLLSFMLSDEITAGAVKTSESDKKVLAKQSHAFNVANKKFREIFPDYAKPEMKNLPDMGKGNPSSASTSKVVTPSTTTPSSTSISTTSTSTDNSSSNTPAPDVNPSTNTIGAKDVKPIINRPPQPHGAQNWMIIPSWRWVIAVVLLAVVGRLSSFVGL
ncbi:uncharacterized protein L199_001792 [Kwoniella botswanensis]|uniref:uncharacterized protein n=1 Tax=Kwoniella botswanensis TaxID=1268659 RepID=UPI00315C91BA